MEEKGIDLKGKYDFYKNGRLAESERIILSTHMNLLNKYIDINYSIIDIGCGLGQLSYALSKVVKKIYAIDPSNYNIKTARSINHADNIEYSVATGTNIQFADSLFDIIVSSEVIEHVRDFKKFISEMHRVGKKGAVYCISSPNLLIYLLYPYYWFYMLRHPIKYLKIIRMDNNLKEYETRYDRWFFPFTLKKHLIKQGFDVETIISIIPFSPLSYRMHFKKSNLLFYILSVLDKTAAFIYSKIYFMEDIRHTRFFILFRKK